MQSGVIANAIGGGPRAVQAWVQAMNAKGGVACHPIRYIVTDDGGDPAKHTALVQQLVEQQNVIAFVQMNSPLAGHSSVKYLESKGVPVIGSEGASPWFYESPMFYPQAASGDDFLGGSIIAVAQQAKAKGMSKIGSMACIEATICSRVNQVLKTYAERVPGVSVVYTGSASLTATDYTSQCLAAKNAGVQALVAAFDYTGIQRVAKSCAAVNFRPMYGTISEAAAPDIAKDKNLDGLVIATNTAPWFAPGLAQISLYNQVMKQFDVVPSADSAQGWVSALLFAEAAKKLPATPASKDLVTGLNAIKNNDLGGTTGKLSFTAGEKHSAPLCYFPVQTSGGTWVSLNGFKRVCV
jgi:ABC-type branched-subunit amino acid transport system substrate-binding protein